MTQAPQTKTAVSFDFQVGPIACTAVADGAMSYPTDAIFPDVSPEDLALQAGVHGETIAIPYTCLAIRTKDRRILVDTGMGAGPAPEAGRLLENLATAGIVASSIDTVVLSHGHPDHIGGLTDADGNLVYPNARYVMSETDWRFWTADDLETKLSLPEHFRDMLTSFARRSLPAIAGRVELVSDGFEVAPGVTVVDASGHTPGHVALHIAAGNESLLAVADAIVHPSQFRHPDWRVVPDFDPEEMAATRRRLLGQAASDRAKLLAYHFPFPGLGYVEQAGPGWHWTPVDE